MMPAAPSAPAPSPQDSRRSEGFLELAALLCPPESSADLCPLLADLLRAASSGRGAIALPPLSPDLLARLKALPHLFHLEDNLLQLPRYATSRNRVRDFFARRGLCPRIPLAEPDAIASALDHLLPPERFPASGPVLFDNAHQRLAIAALVDAPVGVLTGGPGTGKTTAAAVLLALRKRLQPGLEPRHVLLTAPTGKAACRMAQALANSVSHLPQLHPEERVFLQSLRPLTLHRALEWKGIPAEEGGPFLRRAAHPLDATLVLVDEASMVDLTLFDALIDALPSSASLLLLGDSDQLESVEVGGILSELVARASHAPLPPPLALTLSQRLRLPDSTLHAHFESGLPTARPSSKTPLPGLVFGLHYSRRAMHAPWILQLADAFRPGAPRAIANVHAVLASQTSNSALQWHSEAIDSRRASLCALQWQRWAERAAAWTDFRPDSPPEALQAALDALLEFQLLCSTNAQVDTANAEGLAALGSPLSTSRLPPHGCPLLIESNSRNLDLSNGDVGIALGKNYGGPSTLALFGSTQGSPRLIPLAELPAYRPAFALTIHKSQGSEWNHVAIQLPPDHACALLSRNLLYTAITRSKQRLDLFGSALALEALFAGAEPALEP
ncbi:MAG: exodeoxyribonuclease alpha subunit [Verrucomicrobiota bacterium]